MMIRAVFSAGLLSLFSTAALACSTPSYRDSGMRIEADHLAERMFRAASTVQVVEVASIVPWDVRAFFAEERTAALADARPEWAADVAADYDAYELQYQTFRASSVTFEVVEILKGTGLDSLAFGAFVFEVGENDYGLSDLVDSIPAAGPLPSAEDLYNAYPLTDLKQFGGSGSCATPIVAVPGQRYLVFLDASGNLLRDSVPASRPDRQSTNGVDGPNFEAVDLENDAWLEAVRAASTP